MKTLPAWFGTNAPIVLPSGQIVDSGITLDEYESRVESFKFKALNTSDAQGVVDAQLLQTYKDKAMKTHDQLITQLKIVCAWLEQSPHTPPSERLCLTQSELLADIRALLGATS